MVEVASAPWRRWSQGARARAAGCCLALSLALLGCGSGSKSSSSIQTVTEPAAQNVAISADAGPDQRVVEESAVQLSGSGTGEDPLSYSWTQTGGEPALVINNAAQAGANFQAPDVERSAPQTFTFELRVTDSAGAVATDVAAVIVEEAAPDVTVSGTLEYEFVPARDNCNGLDYSSVERRPVRGATVQLIDAESNALIDSTVSAESGAYSFSSAGQRQVFVRVRAELKKAGSPSWDVEVRNNTSNTHTALSNRPLYVLDSSAFNTGSSNRSLDLIAATGWDGNSYSSTRAAAPFAILDTIYASLSLVLGADAEVSFAPLDVFWSVNNSTVKRNNVNTGEFGTSFYDPNINSLFLLGKADDDTEEFDSHVIAHEWGHYFEDNFSRSDSIGGPHGLGDRLDMRLAFGEGWATALSGMALDSRMYCDTSGSGQSRGFGINLESNDVFGPPGWFNELSVVSIMYDLWDSPLLDDDGGSLGFTPLFEVFLDEQRNTPAFTSVFSFMAALKSRNPDRISFIDSLMAQHNINGTGAYGSYESNDSKNPGDAPDVLPIYTDITPDGTVVQLCSNDLIDLNHDGNKLAVHRYLRLPLAEPGRYRVHVDTINPESSPPSDFDCSDPDNRNDPELRKYSDPDFYVLRRGQIVFAGESCTANSETALSGTLPVGDYLIDLLEFRYADKETPSGYPEQTCFGISVSPAP